MAQLLAACDEVGATRPVDPGDVLMALGGITLIASHEDQRELASRLIELLIAGLTV